MNFFNDIIYFSYIDDAARGFIKDFYETAGPDVFYSHLNQIFDLEFRNKILDVVDPTKPHYTPEQQQIANKVYKKFAMYLHTHRSASGDTYWLGRGITKEQIAKYSLGDTSSLSLDSIYFLFSLFGKNESDEFKTFAKWVAKSVIEQLQTAKDLYGDSLSISCPSFDANGNLTGIVFRIVHYDARYKGSKNIFKFYNPYSYSFLFDGAVVDQYEELYVVEGVFDALALYRFGLPNVVCPSMVRFSPWHVSKLKDKKLHIIFDKDLGGLMGLRHAKNVFPNQDNLKSLVILPSSKDFDEMLPSEIDWTLSHLKELDVRNNLS